MERHRLLATMQSKNLFLSVLQNNDVSVEYCFVLSTL